MADINSSDYKGGTKVTVYLLNADGTVNTTAPVYTGNVALNGSFYIEVPYSNGESFLLKGTNKQNLPYDNVVQIQDTSAPDKPIFTADDDIGPVKGLINNNSTTDDNQPKISGTSIEKGGIVQIFDQGIQIGSAAVQPDGSWTFTPTAPLADGNHVITVKQLDPTGNISDASDPLTFKVDTQVVQIQILKAIDDVGLYKGDLANNSVTDDAKPTLVGTAKSGSVVHISENGTEIGSATTDATGQWTFELPQQNDGAHTYTATTTNDAGVPSSAQITLTVDTQAPTATATLSSITDDSGVVGDFITNDNTLVLKGTVNGTLDPTDKVQVSLDGGTTWVDAIIDPASKTWTVDNTQTPLTDGPHSIVTRVVDQAGNIGPLSTPQTVTIDTHAPTAQATFSGITDDTGIAGDYITNDKTLLVNGVISGTLATDEKVQIRVDGGTWVDATLDRVNNTWSFDNTSQTLTDGVHKFETRVIDIAGNANAPVAQDVTVDTTPPLPGLIAFTGITEDTGVVGDYITGDNTLIFNGKITSPLTVGDRVEISLDGGATWINAKIDATGTTWSYDNTANVLPDASYKIEAHVIDLAGNTSSPISIDVKVDTTPPPSSALTFDGITEDTGTAGDFITSDNTLILFGKFTGANDEGVQVSLDGGTTWITATVDRANGTWSYDNTKQVLADGTYNFEARAVDVAGNPSQVISHTVVISTATLDSSAIKFSSITDDSGVAGDFKTNDTTLVVNGEIVKPLAAGQIVQVSVDAGKTWHNAVIDATGKTWSYDNTANALAEGTYTFEARIIDVAGTTSTPITQTVVIDTTPSPAIAQISGITTDSGVVGDYVTNDNTLVVNGKIVNDLASGDKVQVSFDGGTTWSDATVDGPNHTWSYDNTAQVLADGTYTIQTRVIDDVGNVGKISSQPITIDTLAPTVTSHLTSITEDTGVVGDFVTNDNTLALQGEVSGALAAGEKVQISLNGGKTWTDVAVDPITNTWNYDNTDSPLADGTYKFQTRVIDSAGNAGQVTPTDIVIDTRPPIVSAVLTGITNDSGIMGDFVTNDNTLLLNGKVTGGSLAIGDKVQVSLDGGQTWLDAKTDAATRTWSLDNTAQPLADGAYTVITRVVDKADNAGPESEHDLTIDTSAPVTTSQLVSITTDSGVVGDYVTNDNTLVFKGKVTGTLAGDEKVQISLDAGATWQDVTVNKVTGTWTFNNTINELDDGSYTVETRVIDTAGNASTPSIDTVLIDTSAPTATAILAAISDDTGTVGDFKTSDNTLVFQGTVQGALAVDEKVQISLDGGKTWTDTTVDRSANTWSYDNSAKTLVDGTYHVQTRVVDTANNLGDVSAQDVVVATKTSAATAEFTGITTDSGTVGDYITNDNTLLINGKILNNLATGDRVEISLDGGVTWKNANVDPVNHTWSYDNTGNVLADGSYTFEARVVTSENVPNTPTQVTVVIDTTPPPTDVIAKLTAITDDTGVVGDFNTSDNTLVLNGDITGALGANDSVKISLNGGKTWLDAVVDHANKTWTYDNTDNPLVDGSYTLLSKVVDQAGNDGVLTSNAIVIDTKAPAILAQITGITDDTGPDTDDFKTNDNTLIINGQVKGTLGAGEGVEISLDGTTWHSAVVDATGKAWSYDNTGNVLADGTYTFEVRVVDKAGNAGPATDQIVEIKTSLPSGITSEFTGITVDSGDDKHDYQTNDQTLLVNGKVVGTLAADQRVEVSLDNGTTWTNATVDRVNGTWTLDNTANSLAEGTYTFKTRVTDAFNNHSAEATQDVVIDLTAPAAKITFTGISDDTGTAGDYITSDTTLVINGKIASGTLAANEHIEVSLDGGKNWVVATVDRVANTWSLDNTANSLASGAYTFEARVVDQVGNVGDLINQPVQIVTIPPSATASLTGITDDSGVAGDYVTNDNTLIFNGKTSEPLKAGEKVQISLDGGKTWVDAVTDPATNTWKSDQTATPLVDGSYTVESRVIDSAGTAGTVSTQVVVVDTTAPSATAELSSITDDSGVAGDYVTNDNTLIFNGKVTGILGADEKVQISLDGGATWVDATVDRAANTWKLDNTANKLADGTYVVESRIIDLAGNIGHVSAPQNVVVDTVVPTAKVEITGITEDTGISTHDFITKDATLVFNGKVSAPLAVGEKVQISLDAGKTWVDAVSKADGTWSYDNSANTLVDGKYAIQAQVIDLAGNTSGIVSQDFTVDTTPPEPLSGLDLHDDVGSIQGTVPKGGETDDARPEFKGKAPADAEHVNVYDNGQLVGTAIVQPDGTWSFTPNMPLAAGPHSLTATPVDVAGNEGVATPAWAFDLLGNPPSAPAITNVEDNVGDVTGRVDKGQSTDDKTPTISGTGTPGTVVHVYSDGVEVGSATVKPDQTWSVEVGDLGADGPKNITADAVDGAGQKSPQTGDYLIILDTTPPVKPAFVAQDDIGDVQGPIKAGSTTDDSKPTLSGTGAPGDKVTVLDNGKPIGTTEVGTDGKWSFTPTTPLIDGPHNVTVTQTDPAGNTSVPSDALNFNVDTRAVGLTLEASDNKDPIIGPIIKGGYTNDDTPTLSGETTAGAVVTIVNKAGTAVGSATADATGKWSIELPHQADGLQEYTATAVSDNGNTAKASIDFNIDTVKPVGLTIDTVTDDVGLIQGPLKSDDKTDDTTPTLTGHAEANNIVSIYENKLLVGSVQADATGVWTYTIPAPGLTEGAHALTATQTDKAGNVSDPAGPFNLIVDTTAPVTMATIASITDDSGTVGDFITNDNTLVANAKVSAPLDVGDKVQITVDAGVTWMDAKQNADGTWSYDNTGHALADGTYKFGARVVDQAGNAGQPTLQDVVIDTQAPKDSTIVMSNYQDNGDSHTDFYSNDDQFTLNVKGEVGAKVIYQTLITDDVTGAATWTDLNTATIGADGTSSYDVDWSKLALDNVDRKFRAVVSDVAGNTATVYAGGATEATAQNYKIDNVAMNGYFDYSNSTSASDGGLNTKGAYFQFGDTGVRPFRVYEEDYRGAGHDENRKEVTLPGVVYNTDANGKLDVSTLLKHLDAFKNYVFETVDAAGNTSITDQYINVLADPIKQYSKGNYVDWYYKPYNNLTEFSASAFMETDGVKFYNDKGNLAGFATRFDGSGYWGETNVYLTLADGSKFSDGSSQKVTTVDENGYWEYSYNGFNPVNAGQLAGVRLVATHLQDLAETDTANYRVDLDIHAFKNGGNYGTAIYQVVGSYSNINAPIQYFKGQADTGAHDWKASIDHQVYTSTRDNDAFYSNGVATTVIYKVLDTVTAEMNSGGLYLGETGTTIGNGYGSQFDLDTFGNSNTHGWIDRNGDDRLSINTTGKDFVDVNGDGIYDGLTGKGTDVGMHVTDMWNHFDASKDKIDLTDWMAQIKAETGTTVNSINISQFLQEHDVINAKTGAVSTVLSIDRDGAGSVYQSTQFLTLENSGHIDFNDLLKNNIIY